MTQDIDRDIPEREAREAVTTVASHRDHRRGHVLSHADERAGHVIIVLDRDLMTGNPELGGNGIPKVLGMLGAAPTRSASAEAIGIGRSATGEPSSGTTNVFGFTVRCCGQLAPAGRGRRPVV